MLKRNRNVQKALWLAAGMLIASATIADARLATKRGCAGCHAGVPGVTVIAEANAPSMAQIAEKYRGQRDAEEKLVNMLIMDSKKHPTMKTTTAEKHKLILFYLSH